MVGWRYGRGDSVAEARIKPKAHCLTFDDYTPATRPAGIHRGSRPWFSVRRGDDRHGE